MGYTKGLPDDNHKNSTNRAIQEGAGPYGQPKLIHPDAALANALAESNKNSTVAQRVTQLRMTAFILIGVTLISAIQSLLMSSVIFSLGNIQGNNPFLTVTTIVAWVISLAAAGVLLTTKSPVHAKQIVLLIGIVTAHYTITELVYFNVIGLAIDLFIMWWLYELYQSIEAVETPVH